MTDLTTVRSLAEQLRHHAFVVTTATTGEWLAWNVDEQALCELLMAEMLRVDPTAKVGALVRHALERPDQIPLRLCTLDTWAAAGDRIQGLQRATTALKANNVFGWIEERERH